MRLSGLPIVNAINGAGIPIDDGTYGLYSGSTHRRSATRYGFLQYSPRVRSRDGRAPRHQSRPLRTAILRDRKVRPRKVKRTQVFGI